MTDLVTGEAVVLELRLAKLASRALSIAVDLVVQAVLLFGGLLLVGGLLADVDATLAAAVALVTVVLVLIGYPVAFETLTRGRTLGKLWLGLRVVRDDGGPIRFRHALVRALLAVVEIYLSIGTVALFVSLASSRGKRLGDFLAGTVVVRERLPVHAAPLALMPPALASWASTLDLSRVPDDLALAARQLLARAPELAPEIRDAMAGRMAGDLARVTTPPPPPGVPAVVYLSAVVAERRRRETARLGGPQQVGYGGAAPLPYGGPPPAYGGSSPLPAHGWSPAPPPPAEPRPADRPPDDRPPDDRPPDDRPPDDRPPDDRDNPFTAPG